MYLHDKHVENWACQIDNFFGTGMTTRPTKDFWAIFCPNRLTGSVLENYFLFQIIYWMFAVCCLPFFQKIWKFSFSTFGVWALAFEHGRLTAPSSGTAWTWEPWPAVDPALRFVDSTSPRWRSDTRGFRMVITMTTRTSWLSENFIDNPNQIVVPGQYKLSNTIFAQIQPPLSLYNDKMNTLIVIFIQS